MRFKRHIELEHGLKQIDIAPLIDVVFLLIIFFMLTSTFVMQPGIKVNLPRAISAEAVRSENIEIMISGENAISLNGKPVAAPELKILLADLSTRKQPVMIKADRRIPLGRIVEIWDLCRDMGFTQVNIATDQK